jgi:predicted nucleic acid-binding protein
LEMIGYKGNTTKRDEQIAELLSDCSIIPMNKLIKEKYIEIRKKYHLKLADAVIAASAIAFDMPIITADKQFRTIGGLRLIAYQHSARLADPEN